jgi:hypothetical protein
MADLQREIGLTNPATLLFIVTSHTTMNAVAARRCYEGSWNRALVQEGFSCQSCPPPHLHLPRPAAGTLLGDSADQAGPAGGPGLFQAAYISGALRELSVALCRGTASLCRSGPDTAARASARTQMRGLALLSAKVVWACFALRVWVLGFWFGFTLNCVALLCAVYVRVHLVLFPAGGPFLLSLWVKIYTLGSIQQLHVNAERQHNVLTTEAPTT